MSRNRRSVRWVVSANNVCRQAPFGLTALAWLVMEFADYSFAMMVFLSIIVSWYWLAWIVDVITRSPVDIFDIAYDFASPRERTEDERAARTEEGSCEP